MSEASNVRNLRGQYASLRDPVELYAIVRDVAELAKRQDLDPLKDPRHVTQPAWDRARHLASAWGPIPRAKEVCVQLRDFSGKAYPWKQLLCDVFAPDVNYQQLHAQRMSTPDRVLTEAHVKWAAGHVALHFGVKSLRPSSYDRGRQSLLNELPFNARSRVFLARVLPNSNQLVSCAGNWDNVLQIANLEPRIGQPRGGWKRPLSVPSLIVLFYAWWGFLPDEDQMKGLQLKMDVACEDWTMKPLEEWHTAAMPLIVSYGLPAPNPYPSRLPPLEWGTAELDLSNLPTAKHHYTRLQVLEAVCEFKLSLEANETPTNIRYTKFASFHDRLPSLKWIQNYGGLKKLVSLIARNPNWREDVIAEQLVASPVPKPNREGRLRRKPAQRLRNVDTHMRFLDVLRKDGRTATAHLRDVLGISHVRVSHIALELRELGLVAWTEESPTSPNQRHYLTPAGEHELGDPESVRDRISRTPPIRRQH